MLDVCLSFSNKLISEGIACILAHRSDLRFSIADNHLSFQETLAMQTPDVLLVDYYVFEHVLGRVPDNTKVLLLDTGCGEEKINYALISGKISGVIEKNSDADLLAKAIHIVSQGHLWLNRKLISRIVSRLSGLIKLMDLPDKEKEVLRLLGKGLEDDAIAETIGTNTRKVSFYIDHLKKKSNAAGRTELINLSREFAELTVSENIGNA